MRPRRPSFATHVWLLWGLRLRIALNRRGPSRWWLSLLASLVSSAPGLFLGLLFYALMRAPAVAHAAPWPDFILRLLCFVTSAVWVTWPVLSAGVDDHSELSRYVAFPIGDLRLLVASMAASLVEPRAFVFFAPLVGAAVGYVHVQGVPWPVAAVAFALYAFTNAALARVGLHLVLNVLRQRRSAELLGGGFALTLLVASFIPPVDTTWLFELGKVGAAAVPDTLVLDATLALGRFPTGLFAHALTMASRGLYGALAADLFGLLMCLGLSVWLARWLLGRFHRESGRGGATGSALHRANPFARTRTLAASLAARDAIDLWNNPRARLLASVPFVLGILIKLLSGRDLVRFFVGASVDAWLMGGLCAYGAVVIGSTFSQNAFGYDGHGFAALAAAPIDLGLVLKTRNLVHALAATGLALLAAIFYLAYFRAGDALDLACAMAAVVTLVPVTLAAGNYLSLYFPVKFHADLKRRDALPFAASMLGVGAVSLGAAPMLWALGQCGRDGPSWRTLVSLVVSAAVAWALWWLTLGPAVRLLRARRERILQAVTRE